MVQKSKIFRDSIHGYITVPDIYCQLFIDTPLFQRLRHIEQTSMRTLYPSARHDRFVHSLGTFHLGCIAFDAFERNAEALAAVENSEIPSFECAQWVSWRHTFQIACLMHDCGHAPFSHTFEGNYDPPSSATDRLADRLVRIAGSPNDTGKLPDTPHELVSAILVIEKFTDALEEVAQAASRETKKTITIDPVLVARMITGWDYAIKDSKEKKFESCLIKLLNGRAIDVDKLDYIIRDTWASGCDNTAIDTHRLLNSVSVGSFDSGLVLAFEKSALSVIQNVVTARNYLYRWIYSHHKVTYDIWLLTTAVEALYSEFGFGEKDSFLRALFSIEALAESKTIDGRVFSLVADGDITHYLKKCANANSDTNAAEWISRKHRRKAIWKSYAEFRLLFPRATLPEFTGQFKGLLKAWEEKNHVNLGAVICPVQLKLITINPETVYVNMPCGTVAYTETEKGSGSEPVFTPNFFYVYIKKEYVKHAESLLTFVKDSM